MKKYLELYTSFFKVGIMTFGGGLAMLPMLTREVVEKKKWTTKDELMDYYAIGQCTPGVIAVNTATFIGFKQKRWLGAVCSTLGVISPSIIIICLIAAVLSRFLHVPEVVHALAGIRVAVGALMIRTVISFAKSGIKNIFGIVLSIVAFILCLFTPLPTVIIVLAAAISGFIYSYLERRKS